jgi:hypothetical protein
MESKISEILRNRVGPGFFTSSSRRGRLCLRLRDGQRTAALFVLGAISRQFRGI